MADICEAFWKSLHLEDHEDNCEIIVETDLLKTLKVEYDLLKEHSGRWLHFVAVDYPELKESLSPQKLMELKEKAEKLDELMKEPARCPYFKPGYGCDSPVGIGNSVMCRKLPNCEVLTEESFWKQVKAARNKLYEDLPTGDVDALDLLKVVQTHIENLDEILEDL